MSDDDTQRPIGRCGAGEVSAVKQPARRLSPWIRVVMYLLLGAEGATLLAKGVPFLPVLLILVATGVVFGVIEFAIVGKDRKGESREPPFSN